jgi:hypothetical protein
MGNSHKKGVGHRKHKERLGMLLYEEEMEIKTTLTRFRGVYLSDCTPQDYETDKDYKYYPKDRRTINGL